MFDYIKCEMPVPEHGDISKYEGQTKRLFCTFARFRITDEGLLVEDQFKHQPLPIRNQMDRAPVSEPEFLRTRTLLLHGDLAFGVILDGKYTEFVARFTNGRLEWIRTILDLSEDERIVLRTPCE